MLFLFPYKVDRPFRTPWVTIGLIAACTGVFILELAMPAQEIQALAFRANLAGFLTWFSAMFLHGSPMHLLGNMFFLWLFGSVVEDTLGRRRYIALYVLGGLASALTHTVIMHAFVPSAASVPLLGASGAIAAIFGVFAVRFRFNRLKMVYGAIFRYGTVFVPAAVGIGLWVADQLLSGLMIINGGDSSVASWAHIGGVAFGIAAAFALKLNQEAIDERDIRDAAAAQDMGIYRRLGDARPAPGPMSAPPGAGAPLPSRPAPASADECTTIVRDALAANRAADAAGAYVAAVSAGMPVSFDAPTTLRLGRACEQAGALAPAAGAYYEIVRSHPNSQEVEPALFRLAHVYLRMGRVPDARQTWAAFHTRYPTSAWNAYADKAFVST